MMYYKTLYKEIFYFIYKINKINLVTSIMKIIFDIFSFITSQHKSNSKPHKLLMHHQLCIQNKMNIVSIFIFKSIFRWKKKHRYHYYEAEYSKL